MPRSIHSASDFSTSCCHTRIRRRHGLAGVIQRQSLQVGGIEIRDQVAMEVPRVARGVSHAVAGELGVVQQVNAEGGGNVDVHRAAILHRLDPLFRRAEHLAGVESASRGDGTSARRPFRRARVPWCPARCRAGPCTAWRQAPARFRGRRTSRWTDSPVPRARAWESRAEGSPRARKSR